MTNFDEFIERRNTNSIKYDFMTPGMLEACCRCGWDMDFRTPPCVIKALVESRRGMFGLAAADY